MSPIKKTGISLGVLVLIVAGALFAGIGYMASPTRGGKIPAYPNPQKALLVIDLQKDYTGTGARPPFPYKDSEKLIATVNQAIAKASAEGIPVVYIRQEFEGPWGRIWSRTFGSGTALKGSPGAELDRRLVRASGAEFTKPKGDAFSNPGLEAFLAGHRVRDLYLTGLDAEFCVHLTAQGALNRGYTVTVLTDAIALRAEQKRAALLAKYHREGIRLIASEEF